MPNRGHKDINGLLRYWPSVFGILFDIAQIVITAGEPHQTGPVGKIIQQLFQRCVARNLGADRGEPVLRTEISPEKADNLKQLHRL